MLDKFQLSNTLVQIRNSQTASNRPPLVTNPRGSCLTQLRRICFFFRNKCIGIRRTFPNQVRHTTIQKRIEHIVLSADLLHHPGNQHAVMIHQAEQRNGKTIPGSIRSKQHKFVRCIMTHSQAAREDDHAGEEEGSCELSSGASVHHPRGCSRRVIGCMGLAHSSPSLQVKTSKYIPFSGIFCLLSSLKFLRR